MSGDASLAFLDRIERDPEFAEQMSAFRDHPRGGHQAVLDAGYDATPDEIKAAFLTRYGAELTPEQLEAVAGGVDGRAIFGIVTGATEVVASVAAFF